MGGIRKKLGRWGNSTALTIPPAVLEMLGWELGKTEVELKVDGDRLIVDAIKPKPTLFGRLSNVES